MANGVKEAPPNPQFPTHNAPRVWLITSGDSPVGISVARHVLAHGDYVVTGIIPAEFERYDGRTDEFKAFLADVGKKSNAGWKDRLRVVKLDVRYVTCLQDEPKSAPCDSRILCVTYALTPSCSAG